MSGLKPSTVVDEPPDAPPAVSETTGLLMPGGAAIASTIEASLLPSSREDLDVPFSALLGNPSQCAVDSTRGGADDCPPVEKEEKMPEVGVTSTSSPRFTRFLPNFAETFSKLESSRATVQGECLWFLFYISLFSTDFVIFWLNIGFVGYLSLRDVLILLVDVK